MKHKLKFSMKLLAAIRCPRKSFLEKSPRKIVSLENSPPRKSVPQKILHTEKISPENLVFIVLEIISEL